MIVPISKKQVFFANYNRILMAPILFFSFKLTLENKKFKEIEEIENSGFFLLQKKIFLHIIFIISLTASFTPEDSLQKLHFVLLGERAEGEKVRIQQQKEDRKFNNKTAFLMITDVVIFIIISQKELSFLAKMQHANNVKI